MSMDDLLVAINEKVKRPLSLGDLTGGEVDVNHLKRVDKVFRKGLMYYLDPNPPVAAEDASIFFRKTSFGSEPNLGARKVVNRFEELKLSLSAIAKMTDLDLGRVLPIYPVRQDAKEVAIELRKLLYPAFDHDLKKFLKGFIAKLAEHNVLVFEYVETHNQKEKSNIDGFFLHPNVIVLKRQQHAFRREIFTLAHELGHYLLDIEEIDRVEYADLASNRLTKVERWCNDFAYHFLAGDFDIQLQAVQRADDSNDYCFDLVADISKKTHLSRLALFTRLLFKDQISRTGYNNVRAELEDQFKSKQEERNAEKEMLKEEGRTQSGSAPKPIISPLLVTSLQVAFHEGVISEQDFCRTLNVKPDRLHKYLQ